MAEKIRTLKAGEYLFLQGEPGREMYFLKSGAVEVVLTPVAAEVTAELADASGQVLDTLDKPGTLIGEISPILKCPRTASIRAKSDVELIEAGFHKSSFEKVLIAKPGIGIKISEEIARRIQQTNDRVKLLDSHLDELLSGIGKPFQALAGALRQAAPDDAKSIDGHLVSCLAHAVDGWGGFPYDLTVSLALPYDEAGAFFRQFGGLGLGIESVEGRTEMRAAEEAIQGMRLAKGEVLCHAGQPATELYILIKGGLDVVVGKRTVQSIHERGTVVGEMAFLLQVPRTASIVAAIESVVLAVPYGRVESVFKQVPQIMIQMLLQLAVRLHQVDALLRKALWRASLQNEVLPKLIERLAGWACVLPDAAPDGLKQEVSQAVTDVKQNTESWLARLDEYIPSNLRPKSAPGQDAPAQADALLSVGVDALLRHNWGYIQMALTLDGARAMFSHPLAAPGSFALALNVPESNLVIGRLMGRPGRAGCYVEMGLSREIEPAARAELARAAGAAVRTDWVFLVCGTNRWCYHCAEAYADAEPSAVDVPDAGRMLARYVADERTSIDGFAAARVRRLYTESVLNILESRWNGGRPGNFSEEETALINFGVPSGVRVDSLRLDAPPGHEVVSMIDFCRKFVAGAAAEPPADMTELKARLDALNKEEQELMARRKQACEQAKVPDDAAADGELLKQMKLFVTRSWEKEHGVRPGEVVRAMSDAEKALDKLRGERNSRVTQAVSGEAAREALRALKELENKLGDVYRKQVEIAHELSDRANQPEPSNASPESNPAISKLNDLRDVVIDIYERLRQPLMQEKIEFVPVYTQEGTRIYTGRDIGVALQRLADRDRVIGGDTSPKQFLRLPGEGYGIYLETQRLFVVPLFHRVDTFQMVANAAGECRWANMDRDMKSKYQSKKKAEPRGTNWTRLFSEDYRLYVDGKDVDQPVEEFMREAVGPVK